MSMNQVDSPLKGFESSWSIIEKIKKANVVNSRQLLQRYGPELPITGGSIISKKYLSLWTFEGFDHQKLTQALGYSLSDHTEGIKKRLTQMFPTYIKSESLFRDTLHFCKECMKLNYHSLLHQFKFIETCPFHLCALDSECPSCKKSIPYLLPRHEYESGFICNCEECINNQDVQQHLVASRTLKDPNVIAWLSLTEENIECLQKTVIFRPFLVSNLN
ncbi:hypothetical protein CA600_22895 [Paenibacillus sp. VTT E-133280]|uniref:TniQ family protein n=1 Tax=unclassified Paenibacillus TaxID=185978 RepID=UPI000BA02190|nr:MULTISPECIES: TniQ family protein [unclassified Paenibacillus]MBY3621345.1 hypothetical protein [Acinetobacter sp. CUI P1]MDH6373053.1 hypothetical protein [Paenibacillus sp. PastF-3]OZQ62277.1 hypothetical protein CA600_22895 [Paenibacillus sp. VTT E-133280]OZQ80909.1 hypothetical protein CA598_27285 [Paenibacillus sp. VTT E-133291]